MTLEMFIPILVSLGLAIAGLLQARAARMQSDSRIKDALVDFAQDDRRALRDLQAKYADLKKIVELTERALEQARAELREKDEQIAVLRAEIEQLRAQVQGLGQ